MPTPFNTAPDGLTPYETKLGKPRAKWSKAEWRAVTMQLASVVPVSKRGRPALTDEQQQQKTQNLLAAEFWRDQEQESQTQPDWPFPTELPPNRPVPPMPFNPDNYEDAPW